MSETRQRPGSTVGANGEEGERSPVRAVERALRLLTVTAEATDGIGLVDAARAVGLAPSTAHRVFRALESEGFVSRRGDGAFEAGPEIVRLGALHSADSPLQRVTQPHLDALATLTGESCYLAVPLDDDRATYVRPAPSPHAVRHVSWLGRHLPRRGTAVGAALDAQPGDPVAIVRDGVEPDTTAIAAPIRSRGQVVGAVNVVGPSFRVDAAAERAITDALVVCVAAIERAIGAR